jgi:hypothetical protein
MNIEWILEWHETIEVMQEFISRYIEISTPGYFADEDKMTPEEALEWLLRKQYLNICVDMARDLFWHDLSNRYPAEVFNHE